MKDGASGASLQDLIDSKPDLVDYFYNDTLAPHSRERGSLTPVPNEVTNWRDEQRAWRESAVLFDQSHHMPELFLKGPDAFRLLNKIGINSFANFKPGMAKQFVACAPCGYVIGDCILYYLDEESFELVSGMTLLDWVQYNAETGGYDVTVRRDNPTSMNPQGRTLFRYGLDGPAAAEIFAEVVEGDAPDIPFFRTARVRIASHDVLALRHGMAGHKGVELSGSYANGEAVRQAILTAGEKHGIRRAGRVTYFSAVTESGWMAYPVPAIYTDPEMRGFREWLPADSWQANTQLAGSFVSSRIEDYYNNVWELGYGKILKFDHDFIGRQALKKMAEDRHRVRVTLVWDATEFARVWGSLVDDAAVPFKYLALPGGSYGFPQADQVLSEEGAMIGLSNLSGYTGNERRMVSLAMVDPDYAEPGTRVKLLWGEPDGGSRKAHVERHRQTEVWATVAPLPFASAVRAMKSATLTSADARG